MPATGFRFLYFVIKDKRRLVETSTKPKYKQLIDLFDRIIASKPSEQHEDRGETVHTYLLDIQDIDKPELDQIEQLTNDLIDSFLT